MRRKLIYPVLIYPAVVASAVSLSVARADDKPQEKKQEFKVTTVVVNDDKPIQVNGEKIVVGKLWLGVGLKSIEGDLSEYLETDKGVLIEDVHEGSPAAKASIKKGDIILSVDGKELAGPSELLEIMKTAKADVALSLKIRRKNEEMEVKVTPEPRPSQITMGVDLQKAIGEGGNFTFEMFDPEKLSVFRMGQPAGVIAHAGAALKGDLKLHIVNKQDGKSLEVKLDREGDKPATITVTKDGQTKTYTEDQLNELPEDIRGMVAPMLQSGGPAVFSLSLPGNLEQLRSLDVFDNEAEGLKLKLDEIRNKVREQAGKVDEMRAKVTAEVNEATAKAVDEAKRATENARQKSAEAKQHNKSGNSEVEELRAMVEQLKKEIADLKAANKDKSK